MKLLTIYKMIKESESSIFRTSDISIMAGVTNKYGHKLLKRLSEQNLILHLRRDLWALKEAVNPLMLPDYLTAPMPSYISLQSALYYHGLISQIPSTIYAISVAKTKNYRTPIGFYSIHHINPALFFGFDIVSDNEIQIAQPEKALFDFFYLKSAKNKLFHALPEVEIPGDFKWNKMKSYLEKIGNKSRRNMVANLIATFK